MATVYEVARVAVDDDSAITSMLTRGLEPFAVYDGVMWFKGTTAMDPRIDELATFLTDKGQLWAVVPRREDDDHSGGSGQLGEDDAS